MSAQGWGSQEAYERVHGTQEKQAKAQVVRCGECDGPWKLERVTGKDAFGKPTFAVLPNSVRSSSMEAGFLIDNELARTGIAWEMTRL
jgi:hypothetical protein